MAAVILTKGNGHLLGIPDWAIPSQEVARVKRASADVPMFYNPGDVVFVDKNARGRDLRVVGREVRIVNQIDVLAKVEGLRLVRTDDGWQREE